MIGFRQDKLWNKKRCVPFNRGESPFFDKKCKENNYTKCPSSIGGVSGDLWILNNILVNNCMLCRDKK